MILGLRDVTRRVERGEQRKWNEYLLNGEDVEDSERRQAVDNLRRLAKIMMDNLADGSRRRLMDAKEIRLMGGTAMRATRLYLAETKRDLRKSLGKTAKEPREKTASEHGEDDAPVREE